MKHTLLILGMLLAYTGLYGQVPEKMSYQAIIRGAGDVLLVNTAVGMQISVLQGSAGGTAVYVETQNPTTNSNGLLSLEIGTGIATTGTFWTIDWSTGPYFLKTETDPTGGTAYTITGNTELLSVPYALYAKNGIPAGGTEGQVLEVVGGVPTWVTPATCYDGIQNQDETGIDCGGTTCTACPPLTIQELLDAGTTPCDVINVHGHTLSDLYGKTYAGGLIFYLNTGTCTGMVAAPSDQSVGAEWGCQGTAIAGADGTAIGTGAQNTIEIEDGCTTVGTAAHFCANLTLNTYSDWFLPSQDELGAMYINLKVNGFGGFAADWYWSSTEYGNNVAWRQDFYNGNQANFLKNNSRYVRAVRAF
jgi:hypothetical protein